MTGITFGIALLMIVGLLSLIFVKGMGTFWPAPLEEIRTSEGAHYLGLVHRTELIPHQLDARARPVRRTLFRIGNRDLYGADFVWVDNAQIVSRQLPPEAVAVERLEWGPFYGMVNQVKTPQGVITGRPDAVWKALMKELPKGRRRSRAIRHIEKDVIGDVNYAMEQHRLPMRRNELRHGVLA